MTILEKLLSVTAVGFLAGLAAVLFFVPHTRTLSIFLPLSLAALLVNVGLLFLVFRDIFLRPFPSPATRWLWALLIFFFLPLILLYLPVHGFKTRENPRPTSCDTDATAPPKPC